MKSPKEIAEAVAINLSLGGIWQAEADGDTIAVHGSHGTFRLTVDAVEDTAEAWAVVGLLGGLVDSIGIYTDRAEAEAEREQIDGAMNADASMIAVELPQATPRRYEVAGFDRGSIEALIGFDIPDVTDADLQAIASCMGDRYLSSDNFATDLRAAFGEALPDAEHII